MKSTILMIRPVSFGFNEQTAGSNAFQVRSSEQLHVQQKALAEFDTFVDKLRANGIDVIVIDDTPQPHTPDSIFPNNWVSFHEDGKVFLYPMQADNRRLERRPEIIERLKNNFNITEVDDLSNFEQHNKFLEGTGSMVLDRPNKIAYACLSPRTDIEVMNAFCKKSGYSPVYFHAVDSNGMAIYHTNVLMCIGEKFVVICLDTIRDEQEKEALIEMFRQTGKEVIEISLHQMNAFAGNMLELVNDKGEHLLVMSARAYHSLTLLQIETLEQYCTLIYSDLTVIENNGGGSARCMMAEVYLPLK
ncbi:amidinotransferase [Mucilaginibacter sp. HMF5004]|uniref:citrulline utilization hydrolase CtlX n=1 Tax=Mucilaginibacter rivuli TaxID=2857527 RepID=UPI001C5D602A|nr:arginine deiminase-related protein [Mucilaginibacter rivuli]MBW4889533.1 amidinotransferase [Mucilaginibacter rivuli]